MRSMSGKPTKAALRFLTTLAVSLFALGAAHAPAQPAALSMGDRPSEADGQYRALQQKLAQGWNTWDVNSMTTHVLLPEALAVHVLFKHNATVFGDDFLPRTSVGQGTVFPGPHAWDGSYTQLKVTWKNHEWRVESAHDGSDLVLLVTPLDAPGKFVLPPTVIFSVDFLWDRSGTALKQAGFI